MSLVPGIAASARSRLSPDGTSRKLPISRVLGCGFFPKFRSFFNHFIVVFLIALVQDNRDANRVQERGRSSLFLRLFRW